jgi:hypothetical protein
VEEAPGEYLRQLRKVIESFHLEDERASYNGSIEASQASDVGSIPIARSNISKHLRESLIFHIFQNYNFVAILFGK